MRHFFHRKKRQREIYFHEDDYCQQQLLPRDASAHAQSEIKKIKEFSDAHRDPNGYGWTDIYVRQEAPLEFHTLAIKKDIIGPIISPYLPPYDVVYTGYSSHRELCKQTAAWGTSDCCAVFIDWDKDGIVANIWTELFEQDEVAIQAATHAFAALGRLHPLVFVDWAWNYTCDVSDESAFASLLRDKLKTISDNKRH